MIGLQPFIVGTFASQLILVAPQWSATNLFQCNYTANPGLTYVIQRSFDLRNWTAINTNVAITNLVLFQDPGATDSYAYYRVLRASSP